MPAHHPTPDERDERVALPLQPEEALRGLLEVRACAGLLIEDQESSECERGERCAAADLRDDRDAYRAAHERKVARFLTEEDD